MLTLLTPVCVIISPYDYSAHLPMDEKLEVVMNDALNIKPTAKFLCKTWDQRNNLLNS